MNGSTVALDEAIDMTSTGDIWLFRGRSAADLAIRAVTNSPVNHVGMVVAIDDLPPLLWHAELGRSASRTCGPVSDTAAFSCTTFATPSSRGMSVTSSAPGSGS